MIPAFLQCVISLWILLKRIFSFSGTQASQKSGLRREVASEGVRASSCSGSVNRPSPKTSSREVFSGSDRTLQESFDEVDLRYGGSVYESAFKQERCRFQTGHDASREKSVQDGSLSGSIFKHAANDCFEVNGDQDAISMASFDADQASLTSGEGTESECQRVLDESLIMDILSSLQSGNDVETWDNDTTDESLSFITADSVSECSKDDWAQGKDVAWNNAMLALRGCMVGSESENNILALRPEENQRLAHEHRISQSNQLRAIQEWRSDMGETKETTPRQTVNAKYRLVSNFQFPLSPNVSDETLG